MDSYEAGEYSDRVKEAVKLLQTDVIPNFAQHVDTAVESMHEGYKVNESSSICYYKNFSGAKRQLVLVWILIE